MLEAAEIFSADLFEAAVAGSSRAGQMGRRLMRHGLAHGLMPLVNYLSRRCYVQYRPDCYGERFREITELQRFWEHGRRGNNRGDYARLYFLISCMEAIEEDGIPGAIAELGVYKGGSAKVLHHLSQHRPLYLFDTFSGFPEEHASDEAEPTEAGHYACSLDQVRAFLGDHPSIHYCKGVFPTTTALVPTDTAYALVHLDCDLYLPTKAALEFFYPRLAPGGLLILHDYASGSWPGVTRAADEFLRDKPEGLIRIPDKSGTATLVRQRQ